MADTPSLVSQFIGHYRILEKLGVAEGVWSTRPRTRARPAAQVSCPDTRMLEADRRKAKESTGPPTAWGRAQTRINASY
jgi:hypothetical protein